MAKYEATLHAGFDSLLRTIHEEVLHGSMSASYEDGSDLLLANGHRCAHRVYERFNVIGGNRAIWKINTFGENTFGEQSFLDQFIDILRKFQ